MRTLISNIKLAFLRIGNKVTSFMLEKKEHPLSDLEIITHSSRLLKVSEFKLFQIAYSRWYGRDLSEGNMEDVFSAYMMRDEVPHWMRYFARTVFSDYVHGNLDPQEYNPECPLPSSEWNENMAFTPVFMTFTYLIFYLILAGHIRFG